MDDVSMYSLKPRFVAILSRLIPFLRMRGVTPNNLTLAAIPLALATGLMLALGSLAPGVWLSVPPLLFVLMAVNALDGSLSRSEGSTSLVGAALNELVDRLGDVSILLAGFAVAPTPVAVAALTAVLAAETVALVGWGVCGVRVLVGVMGKPDRALVIAIGAGVAAAMGTAALALAYGIVATGALASVGQRTIWVIRNAH